MEAKDIIFKDRTEAGQTLAQKLLNYRPRNPLILSLPRGGVQIGLQVAKVLSAPLDTLVVRKISAPGSPELGVGAMGPEDMIILNNGLLNSLQIDQASLEKIILKESKELKRRMKMYASGNIMTDQIPNTVIIVDDGSATGITAAAAIAFARKKYENSTLVFAAPVCSKESMELIGGSLDNLVCISVPTVMASIGEWYVDFPQLKDEDVIKMLNEANANLPKTEQ